MRPAYFVSAQCAERNRPAALRPPIPVTGRNQTDMQATGVSFVSPPCAAPTPNCIFTWAGCTAVQLCHNQTIILHPHANLGRKGRGLRPSTPAPRAQPMPAWGTLATTQEQSCDAPPPDATYAADPPWFLNKALTSGKKEKPGAFIPPPATGSRRSRGQEAIRPLLKPVWHWIQPRVTRGRSTRLSR